MIGSDIWVNSQREDYDRIINVNRRWLSFFPGDVVEKITFRNAAGLYGRDVTMGRIGAR